MVLGSLMSKPGQTVRAAAWMPAPRPGSVRMPKRRKEWGVAPGGILRAVMVEASGGGCWEILGVFPINSMGWHPQRLTLPTVMLGV